jgi:pimeloyl-ACP methyl ester carboxylesterase
LLIHPYEQPLTHYLFERLLSRGLMTCTCLLGGKRHDPFGCARHKTFVLIHGSWHGGWAWQAVIRHLEERGHHAYAPTLAGHGPEAERVGITHRDCVDSIVSSIRQHDLHDVILVGHSFGGSVISRMIIKMISPAILFLPSLEAYFPHEGKGRMWRKTIASKISFFVNN